MRKELVYSLSALTAFPVTANAAVSNAQAAQYKGSDSGWTWSGGTADKAAGTVFVSSGEKITCQVGKLSPGKYNLVIGSVTTSKVSVSVNGGTAKELEIASNQTVPFELTGTEAQDVSFSVESLDAAYQIGGISIDLTFDFDAAYDALNNKYNLANLEFKKFEYNKAAETSAFATQKGLIDAIKSTSDDKKYAEIYNRKNNELWKADYATNSAIAKAIDETLATAQTKELAYQQSTLNETYTAANTALTAAKEKISADDYKALGDELADLKARINAMTTENMVDESADIETLLGGPDPANGFFKKVADAQKAKTANDAAYEAVKTKIGEAQTAKNNVELALSTGKLKDAAYATLLEEARAELNELANEYGEIWNGNEEANAAGTCVDYQASSDYVNKINGIKTKINAVQTKYEGLADVYKVALDDLKTKTDAVATAKTNNAKAIEQKINDADKKAEDLDKALAALKTKIEGLGNKTSLDSKTAVTVKDLYNAEITAVDDAITDLNTAGGDVTANETAYNEMMARISNKDKTGLQDVFNAAKAKDDKKAYKDYDPNNGQYKDMLEAIQKLIDDLKAEIKYQYDNMQAKAFQDGTKSSDMGKYNSICNNIEQAITFYDLYAPTDIAKYKAMYDAIAAAQEQINKLTTAAQAKAPTLYATGADTDPYSKAWIAKKQEALDAVQAQLDAALAKVEAIGDHAHHYAMNALSTSGAETVKNTCTVEDAALTSAENTFKAGLDAQALAELKATINSERTDLTNRKKDIQSGLDKGDYGTVDKVNLQTELDAIDLTGTEMTGDITGIDNTQTLNDDYLKKLLALDEKLKVVEEKAVTVAARVAANKKALAEADKAIADLTGTDKYYENAIKAVKAVKDYAAAADADTDWEKESGLTAAKDKITNFKTADPLKTKIEKEELTEADVTAQKKAIQKDIDDAKVVAITMVKNWVGYKKLNDQYIDLTTVGKGVLKAETDAKAEDKAPTDKSKLAEDTKNAWDETYVKTFGTSADLTDPTKTTVYGKVAKNKKAVEDEKAKGWKTASMDVDSENYKTWEQTYNDLLTEAQGYKATVKANSDEKIKQNKQYTTTNNNYNDVDMFLSAKEETTVIAAKKQEMKDLYAKLKENKDNLVDLYPKGKSATDGVDIVKNLTEINDSITKIKNLVDGTYDAQIDADNKAAYQEVLDAIQAAKNNYTAINAKCSDIKNFKSQALSQWVADNAESSLGIVRSKLVNFPTDIDANAAAAQTNYDQAQSDVKLYDNTADLAAIAATEKLLTDAFDDYKTNIQYFINGAISGTYGVLTGWNSNLKAAKEAIAGYTADASTLDADAVDALFENVQDMLDAITDARDAADVKALDNALVIAEDQNSGIDASINNILTVKAQEVIDGMFAQADADLPAGKEYLEALGKSSANFETDYNTNIPTWKETYASQVEIGQFGTSGYVDNFTWMRDNLKNWLENNDYAQAKANDTSYADAMAGFAELKAQIAEAEAAVEGLAVTGQLKKQLSEIAANIDNEEQSMERGKEQTWAVSEKQWLDNASWYLYYDYEKAEDVYGTWWEYQSYRISNVANNAKRSEYNYLIDALNTITSAIYEAEKEATTDEAKAKVADYKDAQADIKKRLNEANYSEKTKATDLVPFEGEIADLLAEVQGASAAGQADTAAALESLNQKVADLEAKATLEAFTEDTQAKYADDLAALKDEIAAIKANIEAKKDQISFYKEELDAEIVAADNKVDALLDKADNADTMWKANDAANTALVNRLENLQNNIDQLKEDLADTDNYQNVSIDNFATKMNKIATKMEAAQKEVEEAYAAGTSQALRTETSNLADLRTDVNSIITDIYNSAAQREVKARVEALVDAAAAVTYDASKYTAGDVKAIKKAINDINNYAHTEDNKGILDGDNLANTVNRYTFPSDLATIKTYSDALDEAKRIIAEESLEPEPIEPSVLPGDVTGTGTVDDADFDKFVEDFLNDNLPAAGDANFAAYDANGDGQVDIADVQAIFNLSMGLNVDGTAPGAASAPALDFEGFSAGNMSVQTTQLSNGNTQVAIQLNSTADYRAFAIDMVMADGVSVVAEKADLELLRSNDLGNIHRIVGYGRIENNGTMLTVELAGNGNVGFKSVTLATNDAKPVDFKLDNTTGISTINVEKNSGNVIYDLGGKLMNGIKKGINIIRGKNGETKKVVK
ncbi:MAG: hypothetical protein J6M01_00960 [Prevotella sp.]|nr:hypothetical protein [Prevotella sp.]